MEGLIFGIVDNGILIISMYLGLNVEKWFDKNSSGVTGGIFGAGLGNTASDTICAALDPTLVDSVMGITIGCLIPFIAIPFIEYFRKRK